MTQDLIAENPNPFFNQSRISRAIFDPRKNFLKTIWQKSKPVLDSELNEREDIDNFIRRSIVVMLTGELTLYEGLHPQQSKAGNQLVLSKGKIGVNGWLLIVEKNDGGFPTTDQNFNIFVIDTSGSVPVETKFPLSGLGFSPNIQFDQPVGDNNTTILARGTEYSEPDRTLCVELENTCALAPITYRIETVDGFYQRTITIQPGQTKVTCIEENLDNIVRLPVPPSIGSGNRTDNIYLQVGEAEICSNVSYVKRNGHQSHPQSIPTNIFDPVVGRETTRRSQVQFDLRTCAGSVPEPPKGFQNFPLFSVLRRPGDPFVKIEDITRLVPQIDLTKTGLLELIVQGTGITHDSIIDINDAGVSVPNSLTRVIGSTIHIRNSGPANSRNFTIHDQEFRLAVGETKAVNFEDIGTFNLLDADTNEILAVVDILGWGGSGITPEQFAQIRCAIGEQYFDITGPVHACDDSDSPAPNTEQSLDVRVDSILLDMFLLAICLAVTKGVSTLQLGNLFVDTFTDLEALDDLAKAEILLKGAWSSGGDYIEV